MEMKQSKVAQYLAGNLDMDNTKNKNSLYIELAEKISYGNKDDISAAIAVTDKVIQETGKEPEYDPYVPGLPKRSLGQDIRAGYITPSEEAEKMHMDLKGKSLPGLGDPSAHEIACTDAEVGAKAAGFQTGHPLSSLDKMTLSEQQKSGAPTASKPFDQEGQDMTFGPSKVIKGALSNNMEEVVEGLKETNSIGAAKDLENSLTALSSPGGMAKFLVDTLKGAATAPVDITKNATNLYKSIADNSEGKVKDADQPSGLATQIVEQLQMLTSSPGKIIANIANSYEKGMATHVTDTMNSSIGENPNNKEPEETKEYFLDQFKQLSGISTETEMAKTGAKQLNEGVDEASPKQEGFESQVPKKNAWEYYIEPLMDELLTPPEKQVSSSLDRLLESVTGIEMSEMNKAAQDQLNIPSEQKLPTEPGNIMTKIFEEWQRESFGLAPNSPKQEDPSLNWLDENKKDISKKELEDFFISKMDKSRELSNSLGDNLLRVMEKTLPDEVSGKVYDSIMDDEKIDQALSGDYSKEWEKVEKLFDSGASVKDINAQIGQSATALPMAIAGQTVGFIEKALGKEDKEMGGGEGPKNPTSGDGIIAPGAKGEDQSAPKDPKEGKGPLGSALPSKEEGGGLEAIAGSIARGITYSVARKRGLGPKESGEMAEMAGKEAEDVTRVAASSKDNVGAALADVKTAKNVAAKGMKAATELIPNPAIGKAVAIGIAIADKASDFVIDLVNNNGNATDKLMNNASSLSSQAQDSKDVAGLAAAGLGDSQSKNPTSNDFMTLDAFRESIQKDRKGLTKKLVPKEDFLASGAQTAINSIGSWGSNEVKKANESPKVDEMHKMVDTPA